MTREEAIAILMDDAYLLYEDDNPYNREAYDMAIEALEENESLAKSLNDAVELIHKLQNR